MVTDSSLLEKAVLAHDVLIQVGSPPRVRGKVITEAQTQMQAGITPARAGKSAQHLLVSRCERDHPRACGEKSANQNANNRTLGSPPRVRGKERSSGLAVLKHGITPARAGKSVLQ